MRLFSTVVGRWLRRGRVVGRPASVQAARLGTLAAVASAALACGTLADEPAAGLATAAWKLEAIELQDGRRLEGLIVDPGPATPELAADEISFVQVVRPPARPMYLIVWGALAADQVRSTERLPPAEHEQLAGRVRAFRAARKQRLEQTDAIRLERTEQGQSRYEGADFTLHSSADAGLTRDAVAQLEQVLGGLAGLVPPPPSAERVARFDVQLCGSAAEYARVQESLGIRLDNPAFYLPSRRLLVAGSDMPAILAQRRAAEENLAAAGQRYAALDRALGERLKGLATDLEKQGVAAPQRAEVVQRARLRWERERDTEVARIEAARRENDGLVARADRAFRARLAHEAWHAYADTRLRPRRDATLPAWLDEGLAQVVESAPLEAGELRLDAPDPARLTRLQAAFDAGLVPAVADLLRAGQEPFLRGHAGGVSASDSAYLAAWGLALDVALLRPVLSPQALVRLTADGETDAVRGFERLVGMGVEAYDAEWRRRLRSLRAGPAEAAGAPPVTRAP